MIKVFAKKTFEFTGYGTQGGQKVALAKATTTPLSFCELPDWVVNDPLFGWAQKDGDLKVIESVVVGVQANIQNPVAAASIKTLSAEDIDAATSNKGSAELADMNVAELKDLAKAANIEGYNRMNKATLLEVLMPATTDAVRSAETD